LVRDKVRDPGWVEREDKSTVGLLKRIETGSIRGAEAYVQR
jgi:hypothetical protein